MMTEDELRAMSMEELMATDFEHDESYLRAKAELHTDEKRVWAIDRATNELGQPVLRIMADNCLHLVWGIPERHEQAILIQYGSGGLLADFLKTVDNLRSNDFRKGMRWPD